MRPTTRHPRVLPGHRAWWTAAVTAATIVVAGAFSTMPGILQGPLHGEFHWSRGSLGLAASVNMVLYGLTAPFAASLMDRFGVRRIVVTALGVVTAGALLTTVMDAAWQFTLCWGLLVGLGTGALSMTLATTVANRWFTTRRGLVTGILSSAGVLGQMVFLPALSWTIDHHGWRPSLVTLAVAALVTLLLVRCTLGDHPADSGHHPYGSPAFVPKPAPVPGAARRALAVLRDAAHTAPFWLLATAFAVCGASTNGVMWTHFAPAAHDHGMPVTTASTLLALIGVFNVAGTVAAGWLTDRLDPRRLLAVVLTARGLLLVALPALMSATVTPPMMAFVVLFGLLDLATVPPVIALCRTFWGDDSAIVFGWTNAAHQVGAALAAFLGGVARDAFAGYDPVWTVLGAACAAAALLALTVRRTPGVSVPRRGRKALAAPGTRC
ncbi:putative integral membrane protein [Streptomyces ambofaciens ATCC 23877]|uniref:Putative integral membrane protein n=1 Tax=Streptomyces ambofaciens (strain ATCC 23877 / 3486 / DSM 40053 / JCM 4204 / NBRC 12836 / NRRL B-2516) TaxID=278992 RepID=A0ACX6_STRA7|nr:MFS transporter [Streptomyces ambofaciens]AKZ60007.1 putative integral membrane protein [Streptomyces ambofaciens ATCC 23877]CAJ88331.1 putative integral membrane protein [Streptomyces ambofaciens ATCC 23877]